MYTRTHTHPHLHIQFSELITEKIHEKTSKYINFFTESFISE